MKKLRFTKSIVAMMVRDRIQYPSRLIIDVFAIITRYGVLLSLYWYVYHIQGGTIQGTNFQIVAWSMFFYFSFMILNLRGISRMMMSDIKTGMIETLLPKPVNYLQYRMWWQLGSGLFPFIVIFCIGAIMLALSIGIPASMLSLHFLLSFILVFILGAILSILIYSIVGLAAFWIEEVSPLQWIIDKMVMILGGSYLPVALFPVFMYKIAIYSPFGASHFITHTVYDTWKENAFQFIGIQILWILILWFFANIMFKGAQKKISVNGG